MTPPYSISSKILKYTSSISSKIGEINAAKLIKPSVQLRKENQIKTIQSTLNIEGNPLDKEGVTAIIDNKRVIGHRKDILEVQNAIQVYQSLNSFNPSNSNDFLKAHKLLMNDLIQDAGQFRSKNVGILKQNEITHVAPPAHLVKSAISNLLHYFQSHEDIPLIKSCVVHYEIEFIHPFSDGNGRMGRLWQLLGLKTHHPVFEYMSIESLIKKRQNDYYKVLAECDNQGNSTLFIEYMLEIIEESLENYLSGNNTNLSAMERVEIYKAVNPHARFKRKDYLRFNKDLSTATASRDLIQAVNNRILKKEGSYNQTWYYFPKD